MRKIGILLYLLFPFSASANVLTLPVDVPVPGAIVDYFDHDPGPTGIRYDGAPTSDESRGTAFAAATGTPILAAADGVVQSSYWDPCRGWVLHLFHATSGLSTFYAHLATTTSVSVSDVVTRGQVIATLGDTGSCASGALRFEVGDGSDATSARVDPYGWQGTGPDPYPHDRGYLWTTDVPSRLLAKSVMSMTGDVSWRGNVIVALSGRLDIPVGATLTIAPGTIVKFRDGHSGLSVFGTLDVRGTEVLPVYLTSFRDDVVWDANGDGAASAGARGDWKDVMVHPGGTATLEHTIVRFGGYAPCCAEQPSANLYNTGGTLTVRGSHISEGSARGAYVIGGTSRFEDTEFANQWYGLVMMNGSVAVDRSLFRDHLNFGIIAPSNTVTLDIRDSSFLSNMQGAVKIYAGAMFTHTGNVASGDGVKAFLIAGTLSADRSWSADAIPYLVIDDGVVVAADATLRLGEGTIVKVAPTAHVVVNGTLTAEGSEGSEVYFTSYRDDSVLGDSNGDGVSSGGPGDWRQVRVNPGGRADFSHAIMRYGGSPATFSGPSTLLYNAGGTLNVIDSVISHGNTGLYNESGTATILRSELSQHARGINHRGGVTLVSESVIEGNSLNGILNGTTIPLDARDNWWGSESGPYHPLTNVSGTGNRVSDFVTYDPWLTSDPRLSNPPMISTLRQHTSAGEEIPSGGTFAGNSITLLAQVNDAESPEVRIEVEAKPVSVPFDGTGTILSSFGTEGEASVTIPELIVPPDTVPPEGLVSAFHWRVRGVDSEGNTSEWMEFSDDGADFRAHYTLGFAASRLAIALVDEPYRWGGKGWDLVEKRFVDLHEVKEGYNYWNPDKGAGGGVDVGDGVDCSGLVMWSYDRSTAPHTPFLKNFIKYESADRQRRHNSVPVAEEDLAAGDLLFFDWEGDGRTDHVAMYVKDINGTDGVVHASDPDTGIVATTVSVMRALAGFEEFKRPSVTNVAMAAMTHSPVHLSVTDPDGSTIDHTVGIRTELEYVREVPGDLIYSVVGVDEKGYPESVVYSPVLKEGTYGIRAIPIVGASSTDTYSLDFTAGVETMLLVENAPVGAAAQDFAVGVGPGGATTITQSIAASADTYIRRGAPNKNQGNEGVMIVRAAGDNRALVAFDLSSIPAEATISSAHIELNLKGVRDNWGKSGREIGVHRMLAPWSEMGATWKCGNDANTLNNRVDCSTPWNMGAGSPFVASTTDAVIISNGQAGIVSLDVTADVVAMRSGAPNHGWLIKKVLEERSGYAEFVTREGGGTPRLVVTYWYDN